MIKNNNMKKIFLLSIILCVMLDMLTIKLAFAQDVANTQAYSNPIFLNPALMGANSDIRVIGNYRNQWAAIGGGYTSYSVTAMYPLFINNGKGGKLDIGFSGMNSSAGQYNTLNLTLAVNYGLDLGANNHLCLSFIGGFLQNSLVTNLTYDNQYVNGTYNSSNPSNEPVVNQSANNGDIGFGLLWFMNPSRENAKINAFMGVSGYHLNQPNQTLLGANSILPMRFNYQGGVKIFVGKSIDLSPNIRVNLQGGNVQVAAGLYSDYNFGSSGAKAVIGMWYRSNDAIAFLAGFEYKYFTIGYSYDAINVNINRIAPGVNAHEVSLAFKLNWMPKGDDGKRALGSSPISSF